MKYVNYVYLDKTYEQCTTQTYTYLVPLVNNWRMNHVN